ncbi:MAG: hypothetical protein ACW97G_07560, partial [Candidatus Thorarchaeota archaeon]
KCADIPGFITNCDFTIVKSLKRRQMTESGLFVLSRIMSPTEIDSVTKTTPEQVGLWLSYVSKQAFDYN